MIFKQSTQTKLKTQTIGGISKKRFLLVLIILGVVGTAAPFVHIVFPKTAKEKLQLEKDFEDGVVDLDFYRVKKTELKKKYSYFGFTNKRRFLFAIGLPISLFVFSIFAIVGRRYIKQEQIRIGFSLYGTAMLFTSSYFIIWTIWAYKTGSDYPKYLYYTAIVILSIITTLSVRLFDAGIHSELERLKDRFLDFILEVRNVHYKNLLVNTIKRNKQYKEHYKKLTGTSLHDDAYEEIIKKETETVDRRLHEEAKSTY